MVGIERHVLEWGWSHLEAKTCWLVKCLGLTRKKKLEKWGERGCEGGYPAEEVARGGELQTPRLGGGITRLAGRLVGAKERGAILGLMPRRSLARTQQLD